MSRHTLIDSPFSVNANFPGGNILVERVDGDDVYLKQDLRDTEGDWFHWSFKVDGAQGRKLKFHFTGTDVIGVRGPAISTDNGESWSWMGNPTNDYRYFEFAFGEHQSSVHFAFAVPYLGADLERFLARNLDNPAMIVDELCTTQRGRIVELLRVGKVDGEPAHRIVLTARHHACESMASFALEGFLERVLSNSDTGEWYRRNVEIAAIPFVDKDGVEEGDQGKNRKPHDHNRDYAGESIYESVDAIKDWFPKWSDGLCHFTLDMHCPWRIGPVHEVVQFVEPATVDQAHTSSEMQRFSSMLEKSIQGPLPYSSTNNLRFGQNWNTQSANGRNFSGWMSRQDGVRLSIALEVPYANAEGAEVTDSSAKALGCDLAEASRLYLQTITSTR